MAVRKINIDDSEISVIFGLHDEDYICLTDMVKAGDNSDRTNIVIQNWMRRKDTISYMGVWETLHNPNFKSIEFDAIKNASGTNRFILTAKEWIERTNALGIIAKSGRYGGTYAHKDIAYGTSKSGNFHHPKQDRAINILAFVVSFLNFELCVTIFNINL